MKFLVAALAFIGIFFAVVAGILYTQVKISNQPITNQMGTAIVSTSSTTNQPPFTPPVFVGPTAQPHIKGPSANPPNY